MAYPDTRDRALRKPAFLMLVLLVVSLWVSAGHRHDVEEQHTQYHCAVCVQLSSVHWAGGTVATVTAATLAAEQPLTTASQQLTPKAFTRYLSRAPPAQFSL